MQRFCTILDIREMLLLAEHMNLWSSIFRIEHPFESGCNSRHKTFPRILSKHPYSKESSTKPFENWVAVAPGIIQVNEVDVQLKVIPNERQILHVLSSIMRFSFKHMRFWPHCFVEEYLRGLSEA